MTTGLIEPHYLPSLEYFTALLSCDQILIEQHGHYVKQSYRNRCYLQSSQGPVMLVIPLREVHGKVPLHDVKIDYRLNWQNTHWRTIHSAYAASPYFEHFRDDLQSILYSGVTSLVEFNARILSYCLNALPWKPSVSATLSYYHESSENILDLRSQISPKKPYSDRKFYKASPYHQVFGKTFAGNLSLLDLLCCEGPQSMAVLKDSRAEI